MLRWLKGLFTGVPAPGEHQPTTDNRDTRVDVDAWMEERRAENYARETEARKRITDHVRQPLTRHPPARSAPTTQYGGRHDPNYGRPFDDTVPAHLFASGPLDSPATRCDPTPARSYDGGSSSYDSESSSSGGSCDSGSSGGGGGSD